MPFREGKLVEEIREGRSEHHESKRKSKEVKVIEDQKNGQNDIDNHSRQNYNVEQSCVFPHRRASIFRGKNSKIINIGHFGCQGAGGFFRQAKSACLSH